MRTDLLLHLAKGIAKNAAIGLSERRNLDDQFHDDTSLAAGVPPAGPAGGDTLETL